MNYLISSFFPIHSITNLSINCVIYGFCNLASVNIFYYSDDDKSYHSLVNIPIATSETAGIMKLYNTTGDNEDGTMTQKSITSEIAKKFVVSTGTDEDLIFTTGA